MARKKRAGRKTQKPRVLLSFAERERLQKLIAEDEAYLRGFRAAPAGQNKDVYLPPQEASRSVDAGAIEARIKRHKKALAVMSPESHRITGTAKRNAAYRQIKEDQEWLSKHMLSTYDMGAFPSATDHEKQRRYLEAVEKSVAQEAGDGRVAKECQERMRRLKDLARRLDPDDPALADTERLRSRHRS